jgi:hypothetical protein
VPMLNIDGVVHGNTRAELIGHDSNRRWVDPHSIYNPVIYAVKKMIAHDKVEMVLDLHSHSRKLGTFFYANHSVVHGNMIKLLPMMVCKNDARFDYRSNRFRGGNDQTARKALFDILDTPFVYTIESSFFGYQKENDFKITPYQPDDYREMAMIVLSSFAELIQQRKAEPMRDHRLLICNEEELQQEDNLWNRMNEVDDI